MRNVGIAFLLLVIVLVVGSTTSCKKDVTVAVDPGLANCPDTISFAGIVEPIVELNCSTTGCHDAGAAGGYNLLGYSNISANVSIILNVINQNSGFTAMPLGANKLADSTIQQITCWNLQGALDN
ncbi:MAG: hypothetical protein ACI865_000528 [Flavobacteriaceae bacterium]|jgi:hypothetical protein